MGCDSLGKWNTNSFSLKPECTTPKGSCGLEGITELGQREAPLLCCVQKVREGSVCLMLLFFLLIPCDLLISEESTCRSAAFYKRPLEWGCADLPSLQCGVICSHLSLPDLDEVCWRWRLKDGGCRFTLCVFPSVKEILSKHILSCVCR